MRHSRLTACRVLVICAAAAGAACEATKSSNPLSPSVAGPIPGVTISAPKLLEPAQGSEVDSTTQPITLLLENADSNGVRPLTYLIDLAADAEFTSKVFTREGIAPGQVRTSLRLPDPLAADRTYYWRARAQDGANTGPYSAPVSFVVYTPIVLDAPAPVSPVGGVTVSGTNPTFVVQNSHRSGPAGQVHYTLQLSTHESFAQPTAELEATEQSGQTLFATTLGLPASTTFFWRVRAYETSKMVTSSWSPTQFFRTAAVVSVPKPSPTPTPPPGVVGSPRTISADEAVSIIRYVHDALGYNLGSNSTRESRVQFFFTALAVIHYGHPVLNPKGPDSGWCGKDAGGGRPPSDDVMVRCSTRDAWDTVLGAGVDGYQFHLDYIGILPSDQNVYPPARSYLPQ